MKLYTHWGKLDNINQPSKSDCVGSVESSKIDKYAVYALFMVCTNAASLTIAVFWKKQHVLEKHIFSITMLKQDYRYEDWCSSATVKDYCAKKGVCLLATNMNNV